MRLVEKEETKAKIDALGTLLGQKDPLIGTMLDGKIEIVEKISSGGSGVVYKANHALMMRPVAVKVLNVNGDESAIKRFQQEARAAFDLRHDNIASVHDVGVTPQQSPYLVMDFIDGKSLAALIKEKHTLPAEQALNLIAQACAGFQAAHDKGFIHRDIKPSNLVVVEENGKQVLKIVDFGIAKNITTHEKTLTSTGQIVGSPPYMSPEQCSGFPVDARSDIYSLGCTLFEMLTGRAPFDGNSPIEIIVKHVNETVPTLESLGLKVWSMPGLENLLQTALAKDPSKRFQTMSEFAAAIKTVEFGGSLSTHRQKSVKKTIKLRINFSLMVGFGLILGMFTILLMRLAAPPTVTPSLPGSPGQTTPMTDAERFDNLSYQYFVNKDYERAIPLLEFGIKTYRKENGNVEGQYLADNLQHIGKCYLGLHKPDKAVDYYRQALEIYNRAGASNSPMMPEAVSDYAQVLRDLGRNTEATQLQQEFQQTRTLREIP